MAMNLGDETLHEVSASRAELIQSSSQRSIAASDDFYSLSERAVSPASSDEATTVIRHQSPDDRRRTVSPLLPSRRNSPPPSSQQPPRRRSQSQFSTSHDHSSEIFYMSRSTPSPAPVNGGSRPSEEVERRAPVGLLQSFEESESNAATPRPATIVRFEDDSRPTTQRTIVPEDFPTPPPASGTFRTSSQRLAQSHDPVFPVTFTSEGPRLSEGLRLSSDTSKDRSARNSGARPLGITHASDRNLQPYDLHVDSPDDNPRTASWAWRTSKAGNPVPTPGVDSTPELHFAIDQLTRDDEIRGYGRDSVVPPPREAFAPPPAAAAAAAAAATGATTGRSSRYSEQNDERYERDDRDDRDDGNDAYRASEGVSRGSGTSATPFINREPGPSAPQEVRPPVAPTTSPNVSHRYSPASADDYAQHRDLHSVPVTLRYHSIALLLLLCIFMITALVIVSVHSALSGGLNRYDGTGTSLYFVYKYLPQLLASIIVIWLHVVQDAIQRILPFVLLVPHTDKLRSNDVLQTTRRFKTTYLLPDVSPFRNGEIGLGLCNIVFWISLFTIPLASTVFTPKFDTSGETGFWRWTAVQASCWVLLPIYLLLTIALIFVAFRFNLRPTSLKWDPESLADIFVLLRRGNTTFSRYSADSGKHAGYPDTRPASLGLWRSPSNAHGLSHGIGIDTQIVGGAYSPPPVRYSMNPSDPNSPQPVSHFESWQTDHHHGGYVWLPWYLRPSPVALWIAIALVLLTAFLVVSWVNRAVQVGFNPLLFAGPQRSLNFSSANFLYGFLPALLGLFCYLLWQPIDASYRALQPFAAMQRRGGERSDGGATADQSVLLDYNARPPLSVTLAALRNGHFRVAWISFITPVSMVLPVLAGGVFQAQYIVGTADTIHEIASTPGYIALTVFAIIYALSYLAIWPTKRYRLPHDVGTVADVADFVVGGKMLNDIAWRDPPSKIMLVTDLLAKKKFTGEKTLPGTGPFRFGEHLGIDGKPRQGIYRAW